MLSASGCWCALPSYMQALLHIQALSLLTVELPWQVPCDPGLLLSQVSPVIQALVFSKVKPVKPVTRPS